MFKKKATNCCIGFGRSLWSAISCQRKWLNKQRLLRCVEALGARNLKSIACTNNKMLLLASSIFILLFYQVSRIYCLTLFRQESFDLQFYVVSKVCDVENSYQFTVLSIPRREMVKNYFRARVVSKAHIIRNSSRRKLIYFGPGILRHPLFVICQASVYKLYFYFFELRL